MHTITLPHWLPSPSEHFLIVASALLIYVISARARRERRAPAAAISWVMGLALLPYLMLPLYLMFGQRKVAASIQHAAGPGLESTPWATSPFARM